MAEIKRTKSGATKIRFYNLSGKRRAISIGVVSVTNARRFLTQFEQLLQAVNTGTAFEPETVRWLNTLPDKLYGRLAAERLVLPRAVAKVVTLDQLLSAWIDDAELGRRKPTTLVRMRQAKDRILAHLLAGRDVASFTPADAEAWRAALLTAGYSLATISRDVTHARQAFKWGIRRGMASSNPFADLETGPQMNVDKKVFITADTIAKVIDAAPDAEWRLLIALSRFAGLRVPCEALQLRWSDVDWVNNRITVRSPKTEGYVGKDRRIIPIFAELRPYLEDAYALAAPGTDAVITRYRADSNLRTQFERIIERAGVKPWPKLWHNLRASRQTELAAHYPLATACEWIGNSKLVASGHYLQLTDADFIKATGRGPTQGPGKAPPKAPQSKTTAPEVSQDASELADGCEVMSDSGNDCESVGNSLMGRPRLELGTCRM
jgi:integrase